MASFRRFAVHSLPNQTGAPWKKALILSDAGTATARAIIADAQELRDGDGHARLRTALMRLMHEEGDRSASTEAEIEVILLVGVNGAGRPPLRQSSLRVRRRRVASHSLSLPIPFGRRRLNSCDSSPSERALKSLRVGQAAIHQRRFTTRSLRQVRENFSR